MIAQMRGEVVRVTPARGGRGSHVDMIQAGESELVRIYMKELVPALGEEWEGIVRVQVRFGRLDGYSVLSIPEE